MNAYTYKAPKKPHKDFIPLAEEVCKQYKISMVDFLSQTKYYEVVLARFHYWHIMYNTHLMGCTQIARECGKTHGAILNGLERVEALFPAQQRQFNIRNKAIKKALKIKSK